MWCSERRINNKLSLNCSGPSGRKGGGGDKARRGVLQKRGGGGYLIVIDEQKGGRAWEIPELRMVCWGGWGGGGVHM